MMIAIQFNLLQAKVNFITNHTSLTTEFEKLGINP